MALHCPKERFSFAQEDTALSAEDYRDNHSKQLQARNCSGEGQLIGGQKEGDNRKCSALSHLSKWLGAATLHAGVRPRRGPPLRVVARPKKKST